MREQIDFQEGELGVQNEEAILTNPELRTTVRHGEYNHVDRRGRVHEDPNEPSVFDTIIERAYQMKTKKEAREFVDTAVLRMVIVLKMSRTKTSETFCKAWIMDQLDERVDINATDPYNDRWFDHVLHPRLSHLAQQNPKQFREFQFAMSRFVDLPDLSSTNPTIYRKRTD